jgi:hypothetical protein
MRLETVRLETVRLETVRKYGWISRPDPVRCITRNLDASAVNLSGSDPHQEVLKQQHYT